MSSGFRSRGLLHRVCAAAAMSMHVPTARTVISSPLRPRPQASARSEKQRLNTTMLAPTPTRVTRAERPRRRFAVKIAVKAAQRNRVHASQVGVFAPYFIPVSKNRPSEWTEHYECKKQGDK